MANSSLVRREATGLPMAVLRIQDEFGFTTADLVSPPARLRSIDFPALGVVEQGVDIKRLHAVIVPSQILETLPDGDNWSAQTRRTLARLYACYLVAEDPQRRLDAREVSTLAHQVSLVRHVLDNESLRRVFIADEVGLGKTIEVGLILKELLDRSPQLRVLYLAPARLVSNVRREFDRLKLGFRQWSASDADARLTDNRIIASIHRAVHSHHARTIVETPSWDIIVVDECHHLSDWAQGGGDPREKFKLVRDLVQRQSALGRIMLLSGTPHQGHGSRFENLIGLLKSKGEATESLSGRVIYRTKDDVRDWDGKLLFPRRQVKEPIVVDLGPDYKSWISKIHDFFDPKGLDSDSQSSQKRAAGWRCAQAVQWAASSPQAGVGYLVRQAIRAQWTLADRILFQCVAALRPYRGGAADEDVEQLFRRMEKEVRRQDQENDLDDIDLALDDNYAKETSELRSLLEGGLEILKLSADTKWHFIMSRILDDVGTEKVVLFAQPIETVTAFAKYLDEVTGQKPALIIGGQSDAERENEVRAFQRPDGPQFLVSSKAGGEGLNLQVSRRLVHIDVPWNPMDMEQRVGRVHRFGSRRTIIVDTLVVKDSREEHAYRVAREKLRSITSMMVEPERFEQVFSRVMCLVPPEELLNVLANSPSAPLTVGDQEVIAKVVREGFNAWQDFDKRFSESQKQIRDQNPGLAAWEDVASFLTSFGKWKYADDFITQNFEWLEGELESVEERASVIVSPNGQYFACQDQRGIPAYGPNDERSEQLGLNLPIVREVLHSAMYATLATGAFYVRWPNETDTAATDSGLNRFSIFVLAKQTVRTDQQSGWIESGLRLHVFMSPMQGVPTPIEGAELRHLIRGLQSSTPRVKAPQLDDNAAWLQETENRLCMELRKPTAEELNQGMRHAIWPVACGIVDREK